VVIVPKHKVGESREENCGERQAGLRGEFLCEICYAGFMKLIRKGVNNNGRSKCKQDRQGGIKDLFL
jgi:hypothetical protein